MSAPSGAGTGLFLNGSRETGMDVRNANVTAAAAVANIVKSSLGPVGLDKMLVDDIGDVTITNDGATILQQLEVEHPAAKVLVQLAHLQDQEVGDGTTSVVIVAAELLRRGNELIGKGIHPTSIMTGYRRALKAAVAHIKKELVVKVDKLGEENLLSSAKTSMSSKILGPESDFFAHLAVDALKSVKMVDVAASAESGGTRYKYPLSAVHVLKAHGKSSMESHMVNGFAVNATRAAQGMPTTIKGARIAMLDMNFQRHRMAQGVEVTVTDLKEIDNIRQREMDITKERIMKIIDAGANVILTTKGIDDLCLKYFVEHGCIAARRIGREDLKRLAKATGGKLVTTMADMEGNESFDTDALGSCETFQEERVGDGEMLYACGCKGGAATLVLRGANEYMLDEMDRALHDALCVIKRMLESNALVAGGGAVEASLSVFLEDHAPTIEGREQLAVSAFAEALLVIPKTLAVNAAKDATELVARLRSVHARQQKEGAPAEDAALKYQGLDLIEGELRDNLAAGVVEPAISKIKSLRFATEAAVTILRIDDRIILNQQEQQ
uniref:T-complex protein 1 subunit alpha n=1 Tax=Corethron hystrix TaxID=216773 RepID=A0A7S1BQ62_9STRA|eukprot:CAMPEP_0113331088 /NCGR_PEP_ID=MMETSP0010_2-20120614/22253_1 /TAXON_ID=216773 ORGANISM="Corethron hystrix, Strain 308" /NCGR_SAMPLE_ID=MMETSP0010_2 /ASSEMBLY_ACC=CAM_ASM_000155 /LENGTH=554 /DNA_ID=CAMNT_0000194233 /DNA_START=91 /DNA_END=1758 /DNA_ORIENTATION=- /assembly_acc=CAM_ASM_000155